MTPMTYDEWRVVSLAPWGRLGQVAALGCALAIVLFAWRALRHDEHWSRRWILLALRMGAVAAALVLFFEPAVRLQNVTRLPNHVAVLVDTSESMRLREKPGEPSRAARTAAWLRAQKDALGAPRARARRRLLHLRLELAPTTLDSLLAAPPAHPDTATPPAYARLWPTCARATKGAISAACSSSPTASTTGGSARR